MMLVSSAIVLAVVVGTLGVAQNLAPAAAGDVPANTSEDAKPKAVPGVKRPLWTTSRLVGSPEPPLPYTVEKTFAKLTLRSPIYVVAEPLTDNLWIILQGGDAENPSRVLCDSTTTLPRPKCDAFSRSRSGCCTRSRSIRILPRIGPFTRSATDPPATTSEWTAWRATRSRLGRADESIRNPNRSSSNGPRPVTTAATWRSGPTAAVHHDRRRRRATPTRSTRARRSTICSAPCCGSSPNRREGERPYAMPADNPFVETPGARAGDLGLWAAEPLANVDRSTKRVKCGSATTARTCGKRPT